MCPRNAGLCSSRRQCLMRLVAALCLSWSEPPSRSNLPKDPPSKTATLHKKDDTDTRIIFKSCGTACSLQRFQRLTANFLLSVCLRSAHKLRQQQDRDMFYEILKKCCAMWLTKNQISNWYFNRICDMYVSQNRHDAILQTHSSAH